MLLITKRLEFMPLAPLDDRALILVGGEDATSFLSGLVTCAVEEGSAHYGAILTPQGKIIADFFLLPRGEGGVFLDAPKLVAETLFKRLTLYKLRAKVTLADVSAERSVFAAFGTSSAPLAGFASFADPRYAELGSRLVASKAELAPHCDAALADYDKYRISLAIPQGGRDFAYGDVFPHEAAMDQLHGVDFQKGCYVGQEVVSRMQHRGSARTRIAALSFTGSAPSEGAEILSRGKTIGKLGSVDAAGQRGIGLLRLDRLADALALGEDLLAAETVLRAAKPSWARYDFPAKVEGEAK
jgi:folate-binding protein YgfZ